MNGIQLVKQIFAESSGPYLLGQIAVRCANNSHIDRDLLVASDWLDVPLLNDFKQLGLAFKLDGCYVIQENHPAVSRAEASHRIMSTAGEGPLAMPKKLAPEELAHQSPTVDGHERHFSAPARRMNGPRDSTLTGSGRTRDENICIALGNSFDAVSDLLRPR
jgi:hypothetical protein